MAKKILIWSLLTGLFIVLAYGAFITSFDIFENPTEVVVKEECDYEGLRKIKMYMLEGNATTNNSLHIIATDCNGTKNNTFEYVLTLTSPKLNTSDISFEWKTLDTIEIKFKKGPEIFRQKFETENIDPKIFVKYVVD